MTELVYVGGFGQSGSTLLEFLLTANPGVVACGEIVNGFHTWRGIQCSCGRPSKDCPIWGVFKQPPAASWRHEALVLTLLEHVEGKYRLLTDSSKTAWGSVTAPFRLRRLLGRRFFLIHVVRDPRAVCWSAIRLAHAKDVMKSRQPQAWSIPILRCLRTATGWWVANLSCELFGWLYPAQYLRLLYEDIARTPRKAICAVFNIISSEGPIRLTEIGANDNRHQLYGSRIRRNRLLFVDVRLDDGWKSEMAPRYRRLAGALSWPLRTRYGY